MGKTYRDKPSKHREIERMKIERGEHRRMQPYHRSDSKKDSWIDSNS